MMMRGGAGVPMQFDMATYGVGDDATNANMQMNPAMMNLRMGTTDIASGPVSQPTVRRVH